MPYSLNDKKNNFKIYLFSLCVYHFTVIVIFSIYLDKLCPDPPTEYKATRNYTMPVPGLYTYKSTLTDTCIDGRFLDKNHTKSYTCLQDNKWSQDILMCEGTVFSVFLERREI